MLQIHDCVTVHLKIIDRSLNLYLDELKMTGLNVLQRPVVGSLNSAIRLINRYAVNITTLLDFNFQLFGIDYGINSRACLPDFSSTFSSIYLSGNVVYSPP